MGPCGDRSRALQKRRRLRFLARASLWKIPGLGPILYALGQIPIERDGHPRPDEDALATRLLGEVRERVPPVPAGRGRHR